MQASEYFAYIQAREQGSVVATRHATKETIRQATGSTSVDYHVDQATDRE